MSNSVLTEKKLLTLPSDQEASGRTLGAEEIALITEAIQSGTLTSTKGNFVKNLEKLFAELVGVKYAYGCASGSGAVHVAIAAIDPEPGDEIITTSITDMGALTPIIYQGAIPVFADVDPKTWNVTAETIERCISDRTKAIIVTHLFGNPCNMTEIMELARSRNIPVIEDCAQAYGAKHNNQQVGSIGDIGCFSLQQGKHITTGEGGIVTTNNDAFARRMYLFINKAWGYGDPNPDHYFLALNYRMCELQGAVAVGQLSKLESVVRSRVNSANKLTEKLQGIAGITTPWLDQRNIHTYWKYCLSVDGNIIPNGPVGLAQKLKTKGIFSAPRYIQKPAFMCEIFQKQNTFGKSRFPFTLARPEAVDYSRDRFTGTYAGLESVLVLPWNERYTDEHIDYIAESIREAVGE
ncbi:MAG TPA: DegT/DnrJ/EryC1/StrS family aminotransferase [Cyanobacteria bacterium UBA11369]|nr:DegT/DnrJ/EryC1/StrS family aminotransferase [Cyanobacteria bacterium UBA11371]HBE36045.1 DegT/DnrJ/EryC1/StrS family aminotransferase [Cyanobacteria bacterium UBA11368]HBE52022.1 DegT/DnrJ/EryC1/StrS family aminotransferase [Cyanobacteria bacterium UBA11369]